MKIRLTEENQGDFCGWKIVLMESGGATRGEFGGLKEGMLGAKILSYKPGTKELYNEVTGKWEPAECILNDFEGPATSSMLEFHQGDGGILCMGIPYIGPCYLVPPDVELSLPSRKMFCD
ncbi:hypothetical protein COU17_00325 [Candidatus Kaiserbacteria bacterium CG10_big_fil_rev_8_21_14_0_10_49_17]|uniref:Uncharacterized protein n=1 Tax=Candidatus Kaiserbacteria bacterium CG10_big_fil_rev_8_21_14_0_10_49_17 TaxID=1974609 RepID=A0A2M6WF68_9BACT|nr:MAG: hypothetical protein COU17_00325 [Candidatus Kaiserbacteria bacterium CG10_big_fil_rev_8_21_14_0_10_49_17]